MRSSSIRPAAAITERRRSGVTSTAITFARTARAPGSESERHRAAGMTPPPASVSQIPSRSRAKSAGESASSSLRVKASVSRRPSAGLAARQAFTSSSSASSGAHHSWATIRSAVPSRARTRRRRRTTLVSLGADPAYQTCGESAAARLGFSAATARSSSSCASSRMTRSGENPRPLVLERAMNRIRAPLANSTPSLP